MSGEHFLRIENATTDDEAEYECQAGPRGKQKGIRASAHLNVLVAPAAETAETAITITAVSTAAAMLLLLSGIVIACYFFRRNGRTIENCARSCSDRSAIGVQVERQFYHYHMFINRAV